MFPSSISPLIESVGGDIVSSARRTYQRVVEAAAPPTPPGQQKQEKAIPAPTDFLSSLATFNFQQHLRLFLAIGKELLHICWALYAALLSAWLSLCTLVLMPVVPVLGGLFAFKDADWNTWLHKEKEDFWKGKVAWVTGASSGVGASIARLLAQRGVSLVLTSRNATSLEKLRTSIVKTGYLKESDVMVLQADLTAIDGIPHLVQKAINFKGKLHVLFNNAGVLSMEPAQDASWDVTQDVFKVNLLAPIRLCQEILPHMQKLQTPCHIVFTNSMLALSSPPCHSSYASAKHGLAAYARSLAADLRAAPSAPVGSAMIKADQKETIATDTSLKCEGVMARVVAPFACMYNSVKSCSAEAAGKTESDICVTHVLGGGVESDLMAKRVFSKSHDKRAGVRRTAGESGLMSPDRFAELLLVGVSNRMRECWIGKARDLMCMNLMHYAPELSLKLGSLVEGGLFREFCLVEEEIDAAGMSSTAANTPPPVTTPGGSKANQHGGSKQSAAAQAPSYGGPSSPMTGPK